MTSTSTARRGFFALAFAAALLLSSALAAPVRAATNLIANGDLEASTTVATLPDHWTQGYYGANTVTYGYGPEYGRTGKGINVNITTYVADDAKWVFDSVPVTGSSVYDFSDWYTSDATSYLVAQFTLSDDSVIYSQIATLPPAANWTQTNQTIIIPADAVGLSVFHVLRSTGSLSTDDYSLSLADASQTQFDTGVVSLTFDDGWTSQYTNAFPLLGDLKATFYIIGKALKGALIVDLFADSDAFPPESAATTVATSTGIAWGTIYPDPTLHTYEFSDIYSASSTNSVIVTYSTGDHTATSTQEFPFAAGTNQVAKFTLDLPTQPDAGLSIRHTSSDNLSVSAKSLTADATGYMTGSMLQELAAAGNEIGNHTESHCNLVFVANGQSSTDPNVCSFNDQSGLTYQSEIDNGSTTLKSFGFSAANFAYPNGANNSDIREYLASHGFTSARTVDEGLNTKQADRMALKVEVVDNAATVDMVKGWIDNAAANKLWLILVFHQVDNPAVISSNGEDGGTTPAIFGQITDYLKNKSGIQVKTIAEALGLLTPATPADTTAPVIAAHEDVTATATSTSSVGADVTYTDPIATDDVDASVSVSCTPASGSFFIIGTTTITCSAQDAAGNEATPSVFSVVVSAAAPEPAPQLSDEAQGSVSDTSATITWMTDHPATSRVVWGTSSVLTASTTEAGAPNYGYPNSTDEDSTLVTSHSVTVSGLSAGTTYYFRPVSHGSPEAVGAEVTVTTSPAPVVSSGSGSSGSGSSGGSGGGGGIVGSGPLSIGYVNTNPTTNNLSGQVLGTTTESAPNCFVFQNTLSVGSTGVEVTELQNRLTLEGLFKVIATGYFGPITKTAVMGYQAKNNIETVGIVGPKTRAALNASCAGNAPVASQGSVLGESTVVFTQTLTLGSTGAEVSALQQVLINLGFLKIAAPTGYFGPLTKAAVIDYQLSRGIEGVGVVGPKTRAALNANAPAAVSLEK